MNHEECHELILESMLHFTDEVSERKRDAAKEDELKKKKAGS